MSEEDKLQDNSLTYYKVDDQKIAKTFKDNDTINYLVNKIISVILSEDKDPVSVLAEARAYARLIRKDTPVIKSEAPKF